MTATSTRRERQRQATYEEIVEVSRRLLRDGEDVSIRAVATAMGLTPPALYRYVDSHAELMALVARSVFQDVVASMTVARDAQAPDDPAAQIVASAAAFRGWAMTHREEFQLVFASAASPAPPASPASSASSVSSPSSVPAGTSQALLAATQGVDAQAEATQLTITSLDSCLPSETGVDLFGAFFSEIFGRLWERYKFPVPADADLDPDVLAVLRAQIKPPEVTDGLGAVTPGMIWMFERAWARLYGTVTLEVFGHVHPVFISSGALFRAAMLDIGRELTIDSEWGRLQEVASRQY
jgi:AcrR family transcriptional regulator